MLHNLLSTLASLCSNVPIQIASPLHSNIHLQKLLAQCCQLSMVFAGERDGLGKHPLPDADRAGCSVAKVL